VSEQSLAADTRDLVAAAAERLGWCGIGRPLFEAQLLLAHATGSTRLDVLRGFERSITAIEADTFLDLVERRAAREPLAYLRGVQEFYGLPIAVSRAVLVPRPETELLVDFAVECLRDNPSPVFLDAGAGSGAIAVAALHSLPNARAIGLDVSRDALALAHTNAVALGVGNRLRAIRGDMLGPLRPYSLDLVVSNPPYIPTHEIPTLQPEVADFEPRAALDGGEDGLAFYRPLAAGALRVLKPGAWLAVEVGRGQSDAVSAIFKSKGFADLEVRRDLAGIERMVAARRPQRSGIARRKNRYADLSGAPLS
jgi:release factor glutamine methyltransferase